MSLTATFDELVSTVLQVQRKTEALVDKLHYINANVHGIFGDPDLDTIQSTLDELQLDLPELSASAALPLESCAALAAAVARMRSEEDALHLSHGSAADDAGPAAKSTAKAKPKAKPKPRAKSRARPAEEERSWTTERPPEGWTYYVIANPELGPPGVYFSKAAAEAHLRPPFTWGNLPPYTRGPSVRGFADCRESFDYCYFRRHGCTTCQSWRA